MAVVEKSMLVAYSAEKMFDLVNDVEHYQEFLPWCSGVEIMDEGEQTLHAALKINYKGVRQQFSTRNRIDRPDAEKPGSITMSLVDGPFSALDGRWDFKPLDDAACKIEFRLHYDFSSKLLEKMFGSVFSHIANSFVDAFVKRAEILYGRG
ncbi:MAG TPA: type II toxin-antitoxin system RatA family toxin [Burkholderiales bacterium]|nr:type II toxin-antitoxin system RatA family toxin [Burkholderiales bacterium]